jgi:hypothetical protein
MIRLVPVKFTLGHSVFHATSFFGIKLYVGLVKKNKIVWNIVA